MPPYPKETTQKNLLLYAKEQGKKMSLVVADLLLNFQIHINHTLRTIIGLIIDNRIRLIIVFL